MLVLVPLAAGIAAGLLAGGRMVNWLDAPFRWPGVVIGALLVREAVALTPLRDVDWLRFVYAGFMVVLLGWSAWHVRRMPGIWIVSVGALMNLLVIAANDFRMPVAPDNAGLLLRVGHAGQYVLMGAGTRVAFLGDWIAVPAWLGGAYSPGDMVIAIGAGVAAFLLTAQYRAKV